MDKEKNKLAKLLTGEHITGLSENSEFQNVADELEGDEYVQFPDNTTQRVEGKKHTKGGEDMVLPNGTKVLTASIKVGAREAKKLSDQYGFKVNKEDTYSKVLDKYKKHVGLEKLNEEQEEYIKEQMKLEESDIDAGSLRVNQEFISSKINDLEGKKSSLEQEKAQVFKTLYDLQEQKKEGKAKYQKEGMMKYGGTLKPKREKTKFKVGGKKMYQDGGGADDPFTSEIGKVKEQLRKGEIDQTEYLTKRTEIGEKYEKPYRPDIDMFLRNIESGTTPQEDLAFRVIQRDSDYTRGARVRQPEESAGTYGTLTNKERVQEGLTNLKNQFPIEFQETFGKNTELDSVVDLVIKNKSKGKINELQDKILKRQNKQADFILNNQEEFGQDAVDTAQAYLENETFLDRDLKDASEEERVRGLDSKLGNFTASRFALGVDLVTPEDRQKLMEEGIFTTQQLRDSDIELSDESKNRLNDYNELVGEDDPNFALFEFNPQEPAEEMPPAQREDPNIVDEDPVRQVNQRYPRAYYTPDQSVLPPGGLEAHLKGIYRGQTQDAPSVGVEDQLQQAATQRMQASEQLRDLPPMQRAAAIANMSGQLQQAENQTITAANRTNAQNLARTEMFNVQQADKENVYAGNNALNYEQRQLTAKAKTDEELRNYLDYNRKVALTNFRNTQDRNLIASVFPDYDTDFYGMKPVYEPEDPNWTVEDRTNRLRLMRATGNQTT